MLCELNKETLCLPESFLIPGKSICSATTEDYILDHIDKNVHLFGVHLIIRFECGQINRCASFEELNAAAVSKQWKPVRSSFRSKNFQICKGFLNIIDIFVLSG